MFDLLRPSSGSLTIREDIRKGVYVEGLCEKVVESGEYCVHHLYSVRRVVQCMKV